MLRCPKIAFLTICAAMLCWAQDRGTITGTVTDNSGGSVAGAKISIKNLATGLEQNTVSASDGRYSVPYLPVGNYSVNAEQQGFGQVQQSGVRVEVASVAVVDFKLQVGTVQQSVEVTSDAPLLQTERSDLGKVMNTKEIIDLPLALGGGLRDNLAFAV
ncbi:MAG: carboxypeptidase-like regulatory domain-containing protein, partial [Acidobacteriota bacterium]|nr:carboxypeptidase-like regulatory domain-containing protein [Acidobacteriota bacterium]